MSSRLKSRAFLSATLVLLLSQTACLRTRLMAREGSYSDATPNTFSAPSAGDSAAASASSSYLIDELKAEIARLSGRVEELERGKSTESSSRNDAALIDTLKKFEGRIVELEKTQLEILERLKGVKGKFPTATASASSDEPTSSAGGSDFERGKSAHAAGRFEEAIEALDAYISQQPRGKNAEEAFFLKGESLYLTKQYKSAIVDFSKVSEKFPKSKRIPSVLLRIGQSFEGLGMGDDAKGFYQELVDRFPKSSEAKKAKSRLKG